jgi:hypothetical protein
MNSVILIVKSPYKLWFSHLLKKNVHFISVKPDLSNLIKKIKWCINNDVKCKKIASNAREFYLKYLVKDGIFNYMEEKLNMIHHLKNYGKLLNNSIPIAKNKKNIAIITCFRDTGDGSREKQRLIFIQIMNTILEPYCNFHIYIIEQSNDGEKFNIGKLKNIGYDIASKDNIYDYDHYIFSDIDTIPDYDLMNYFLIEPVYPISLAIRGTRYSDLDDKIKKLFVGALISFTSDMFIKMNGYPNNFWGWGGEDDALINRMINIGCLTIYYPKIGYVIDFEETDKMKTINNVKEKLIMTDIDQLKFEKSYEDLKTWKKNGLSNLDYKIISNIKINNKTTQIKVNLLKKEDDIKYSYLTPKNIVNYKKLKLVTRNRWNNIAISYI